MPLHALSESRLLTLKEQTTINDIRLEVGARKLTEDHLRRYLEISKFLKAPLLRFVVDDKDYQPSIEDIVIILKNFLPTLKDAGIILGIENHDRFKAIELASIIEKVGDNHVGVCLDTVNSLGAGEGLEHVTNILARYTVNLHIKDFCIRRFPHNMGFVVTGTPTGIGMMDLPWLISKLTPFNRCQSAVLEQWVDPETNLEDTIKKENLWAEQSIEYLQQLPYFKRKDN
jgi:sugar phosphate isomerase/epimerase